MRPSTLILGCGLFGLCTTAAAQPHEAVLIVDPTSAESLHAANYYAAARGIPRSNLVYFDPGAPDLAELSRVNHAALFGSVANQNISDPDYVVLMPDAPFFVPVQAGLIVDGCSPVNRFSLASAYALAPSIDVVLAGTGIALPNGFASTSLLPRPFDSDLAYEGGKASVAPGARNYFLGAALGYTGERGNTLDEVFDMIDRSVASDGTSPAGEHIFVRTTDALRSAPRHNLFASAINAIVAAGADAKEINGVLPVGGRVCTGVMTGAASPNIDGGSFELTPGSFADHLTSFSGTFDNGSQTKMSRWIAKGASATAGCVEEPCNYAGKFPAPRIHSYIARGSTLGEAFYRSVGFTPMQVMLMGDPLTRAFAILPSVSIPDAPAAPVSCSFGVTPTASTAAPGTIISDIRLYIGAEHVGTTVPGALINIDVSHLPDGPHTLRAVATDSSDAGVQGSTGVVIDVNNHGFVVPILPNQTAGDLDTVFSFDVDALGAVTEVRLMSGARVVASAAGTDAPLMVSGHTLGAGPAQVHAEVDFAGGERARSASVSLSIDPAGSGGVAPATPSAFSYTKRVSPNDPFVVELPALTGDAAGAAVYSILSHPAQSAVLDAPGFQDAGPYRIYEPQGGAAGTDTLTFMVETADGASATGQVTLHYAVPATDACLPNCPADVNADGLASPADFTAWLALFQNPGSDGAQRADINRDAALSPADFTAWLAAFAKTCD